MGVHTMLGILGEMEIGGRLVIILNPRIFLFVEESMAIFIPQIYSLLNMQKLHPLL
jgi:hypothetical protein